MFPSYSSEGIVLARRNFGEADRILILYTKHSGKLSFIAKGVRRPKSRKMGHVEVFNQIKFHAAKGSGLDILTEAEVLDDFNEVRGSLRKISLAYYFSEVVARISHEGEANEELYELILETFERLKKTKALKNLRLRFITKLLILMGYWPQEKELTDPDKKLEEVVERQIYSERVGKVVSS